LEGFGGVPCTSQWCDKKWGDLIEGLCTRGAVFCSGNGGGGISVYPAPRQAPGGVFPNSLTTRYQMVNPSGPLVEGSYAMCLCSRSLGERRRHSKNKCWLHKEQNFRKGLLEDGSPVGKFYRETKALQETAGKSKKRVPGKNPRRKKKQGVPACVQAI